MLVIAGVVAIIKGVVMVIKTVVDAIKRNEEATMSLKEAFSAFNPVLGLSNVALKRWEWRGSGKGHRRHRRYRVDREDVIKQLSHLPLTRQINYPKQKTAS